MDGWQLAAGSGYAANACRRARIQMRDDPCASRQPLVLQQQPEAAPMTLATAVKPYSVNSETCLRNSNEKGRGRQAAGTEAPQFLMPNPALFAVLDGP